MDKALISFSFDDAREDNTAAFDNILIPRNIPATLNVTTGYIDGTAPKERFPHYGKPMLARDVIRFNKENGFEIALHGDKHLNTEEDISASYEKVMKWLDLPENTSIGFASPNSGLNIENFKKSKKDLFTKKISYVRTSLRIKQMKLLRTFFRKLGRFWHLPIFYKWAYQDTIMKECNDRVIYSVPIVNDITWKQVASLVDECVRQKGTLTLMFHSIDEDSDSWSWSNEKFINLCDYLVGLREKGDVELCTTAHIFETIKNRTN